MNNLKSYPFLFFDFDGVIKDSIAVKSHAFGCLFSPFGEKLVKKVRSHHELNGGMSRFDKLPLYLEWSGKGQSVILVNQYAKKFSQLVKQKVIDSEWVDGSLNYLQQNHNRQQFFLVTATPQQEIEDILAALGISHFFKDIIGSPIKKADAIKLLLERYDIAPELTVMVGDSIGDYHAATENKVHFILRKTSFNKELPQQLNCKTIENFL
jgi:phosphoglycolate phosphatase-like HAD superfamily hydrolase